MNRVMHWNAVALECVRRDHSSGYRNAHQSGPTRSSRALALVHLAVHDAVALFVRPAAAYLPRVPGLGLPGTAPPALPGPPPAGASQDDAIDAAASAVLRSLYPGQADLIVEAVHGSCGSPGWAIGFEVAKAYCEWRQCDGAHAAHAVAPMCPPSGGGGVQGPGPCAPAVPGQMPLQPVYGDHRPDPFDLKQGLLDPGWGDVWRLTAAGHAALMPYPGHTSRVPGPGMIGDQHHRDDFLEVRDVGALRSTKRSVDQTVIGVFWGYDGANQIGVPPRLYNQIVRQYVMEKSLALSVESTAALFAMVNVAMADAGIDAWHYKYKYNLWRPVVGVRREEDKQNPDDPITDPLWAPYGLPVTNRPGIVSRTPPFPAYPSGHATFGAALFQVMRMLFVDPSKPIKIEDVLLFDGPKSTWPAFDKATPESMLLRSDEFDGAAVDADGSVRTPLMREFRNFAHAVHENAVSRVYLGVHWRFDGLPAQGSTGAAAGIGGVPLGLEVGRAAVGLLGAPGATLWTAPPAPVAASASSSARSSARRAVAGKDAAEKLTTSVVRGRGSQG